MLHGDLHMAVVQDDDGVLFRAMTVVNCVVELQLFAGSRKLFGEQALLRLGSF